MRAFRFLKIVITFKRYGLFDILKINEKSSKFAFWLNLSLWFIPAKARDKSLPFRVRLAFEQLGPVFVKFGQLLSTRPDLIPSNYLKELSVLQSNVKAFDSQLSRKIIENSLDKPLAEIFIDFSDDPVASASIAQVHYAKLIENNQEVAIKVLRPGVKKIIVKDIKLMSLVAWLLELLFSDGKRLRPREIVAEFEATIYQELDFLQEAANCTELKRLHKDDTNIIMPEIYYDYTSRDVITMEWMHGMPISDVATLRSKHIDLVKLSHAGVEIFYTQVFHFGFFHKK